MKKLFLIPARGGSKGLPRKNILELAGRPMIHYTIDAAKGVMGTHDRICVSTDDEEIKKVVEEYGVNVPFIRPAEFASDSASSEVVIKHAIEWYRGKGEFFDIVVLLQVTSPLRSAKHINDALSIWNQDLDMVVSVKETDSNPYYVLFEEDKNGFLSKSKKGMFTRRQDCPKVYEYNGAVYVFSVEKFESLGLMNFRKIKKSIMSKVASIDIDDKIDFMIAQYYLENNLI